MRTLPYPPVVAQAWDLSGIVVIGINPNPPVFVKNIEQKNQWSLDLFELDMKIKFLLLIMNIFGLSQLLKKLRVYCSSLSILQGFSFKIHNVWN